MSKHVYPIYKKATGDSMVVKFTFLDQGKVVIAGSWPVGASILWKNHTDKQAWEDWVPPEGWVDPVDKPKTKTVYEWMLTRYDGSITLTNTVCTEEMASEVFADCLSYKKTGRSWEVEA